MNNSLRTLGASNHCDDEREINDYYATGEMASKFLMELVSLRQNIVDNSVGGGHLVKEILKTGRNVVGYDIVDRLSDEQKQVIDFRLQDFLQTRELPYEDCDIVMNPPYKLA